MFKALITAAVIVALPLAAAAQTAAPKTVTKEAVSSETATIKAIDQATRAITLQAENGDEDTFTAGPEVQRFNQLKVGDKIRVTYYESLVFEVRKPGMAGSPSGDAIGGGRLKNVPGGVVGAQQTRTVTVKAVDMNVPSITVTTEDGHTMTRKIEDKKNLEGVKAGDKIDITYTQALIVNAEPSK